MRECIDNRGIFEQGTRESARDFDLHSSLAISGDI